MKSDLLALAASGTLMTFVRLIACSALALCDFIPWWGSVSMLAIALAIDYLARRIWYLKG